MALEPTDVLYSTQSHMLLAALIGGAKSVVPRSNPNPRQFIDDLARYRVTHTYAVPFEIAAVVRVLEQRKQTMPAHLESVVLGGAAIHRAFLARLRAVCQSVTDIWCAYAMTEMFPVSLIESREKLAYAGVGDLVGTPIAGATVEVAADGELMVRGPNLFERYLGHSAVKLHATGDLGRIDPQGRIVLLGRKKDMIIRGHYNIYPSLYEAHILAIPGVETCALVGVLDDDQADERVVLAIQPRVGEDPQHIRQRVADALHDGTCPIDAYAQPDSIVVCTVPHSGRGLKPDRRRLVELISEMRRRAT
jgi:acyl-CoA synthetase (AMP-forming)/AMP-acid ligase II